MRDVLRPYVPEYKGQVNSDDGERKSLYWTIYLMNFISLATS